MVVRQMKISGSFGNRIPDLLGFVNGIPLLFIELKVSKRMQRMRMMIILEIIKTPYRIY